MCTSKQTGIHSGENYLEKAKKCRCTPTYQWQSPNVHLLNKIRWLMQRNYTRTTLVMQPGRCFLIALTTWKISTFPSTLHCSQQIRAAQNIALQPTLSLKEDKRG